MKRLFHFNIKVWVPAFLTLVIILATAGDTTAQTVTDTTVVEEQADDPPPPPAEEITDENKDEKQDKKYFHTKRDTDSFTVSERKLPPGYAEGVKKDDDFWYADKDFNTKKKNVKNESANDEYIPLGQRSWVQTLLWIVIIGAFAAAIMFYLADSNVGLFRRRKTLVDPSSSGEEEIPEDIFAINYQKEIDKAAAHGNYRLGIRLMFLR